MNRTLLFVAGPSGSGKSRLARIGHATAVSLDEFYHDHDHPGLPRSPLGIPDWDDVATLDLDLAVRTLERLLVDGVAEIPDYDISTSTRRGMREFDCRGSSVLVAEGIFAPPAYAAAVAAGLPARAIWLDRPRAANFSRRLARDLREKRKRPTVLLRRGVALYRDEPRMRKAALAAGFTPVSMRRALQIVQRSSVPQPS